MDALSGVSGQPHNIQSTPQSTPAVRTETAGEAPAAEQAAKEHPQRAAEFRHEPTESPGQYWLEPTAEGPAVRFEPPTAAGGAQDADRATDSDREAAGRTRCSTDAVDREIAALHRQVSRLEQQLMHAGPDQEEGLQKDLDAAKRELAYKDNDAYRRQHAVFTDLQ